MNYSTNQENKYRVNAYFDGQNLFHSAKECFGYTFPNYDPIKLTKALIKNNPERTLKKIHFYTGIHKADKNPLWHRFWTNKLLGLRNADVDVFTRELKYDDSRGREKGIDVRIALDLVRGYRIGLYDVAIIFSQDSDLEEAINEIYDIKKNMANPRWVKLECAYPCVDKSHRGLNKTDWIKIDKELYEQCLDSKDYFFTTTKQTKLHLK